MKKFVRAAVAAVLVSGSPVASVSAAPVQNEIMFMLDSSGGLYDSAYSNWQAQIGWVQNFIDQTHRADGSNAYGIMTFAGLSNSHSPEQNIANGGVRVLHGLWPGTENPHPDGPMVPPSEQQPANLADYTSGISNGDFLRGYTRATEALRFVHDQFRQFSSAATNKYIFMLTDGGFTSGYLPADPTFVSDELQALRDEDYNIAAVAISGASGIQTDLLEAMVSDPALLFSISGFDNFSDFLPTAQVAMPAPGAVAFLMLGLGAIALRRRRT